ncbi:hypothetical protein DICPUDRAFT_86094 [Dictyostelium purpureum]|uniref:Proliferating cell nuclear antigen PCNA C-terminal domain-containing protein n=1 Tax=Dictyostelium purpureum TaxID=5786 RepID=F0Z9E8_DICPU|nr:uncharacterized protein DICPUDRAFT_86094 [Dictyostelium purpureum]EGC39485.1 hypothetical protein DICPUDRAFT_86094 [Dictyostelium purpureum]|eukprot:XP_003284043.1 hypothetical protein DICPUDRAFT_86094 [Dictyostelium purpureum]
MIIGYNDDFFYFRIVKKNGSVSNFRIPEIYTDFKEKNTISNSIDYQCEILLQSNILLDICNEFKAFKEETLIIQTDRTSVAFKIKDPLVYAETILENKKTNDFYISNKNNLNLEFKVKYFLNIGTIVKKININECLLQIGQNLPLSLVFSISSESSFQFYLAPLLTN